MGVTSGSWNQSTETPKVICVMSIVRIRNGGIEQYSNLLKPVHTRAESLDRQRPESLMPLAPASVRHTWDGSRFQHDCWLSGHTRHRKKKKLVTHRHVYICVHTYVHEHGVCVCTYISIGLFLCVYTYVYVHMWPTDISMWVCNHVQIHMWPTGIICVCIYICIHTLVHVCVPKYTCGSHVYLHVNICV